MFKNTLKEWSPQVRRFYRACGIANMCGGVILSLSYILLPVNLDLIGVLVPIIFMVAFGFIVIGLVGLYVRHLETVGNLGFIGFSIAIIGVMGLFGFNGFLIGHFPNVQPSFAWFTLSPGPENNSDAILYFYAVFTVCYTGGYIILAWSMFRAALLPLAAILMLMIGLGVFTVGLLGSTAYVMGQIGAALFGLALLWLGFVLWFDAKDSP